MHSLESLSDSEATPLVRAVGSRVATSNESGSGGIHPPAPYSSTLTPNYRAPSSIVASRRARSLGAAYSPWTPSTETLTGQLGRGHRHQQLASTQPTPTLLDRAEVSIEGARDREYPAQLPDRLNTTPGAQPVIRRPDPVRTRRAHDTRPLTRLLAHPGQTRSPADGLTSALDRLERDTTQGWSSVVVASRTLRPVVSTSLRAANSRDCSDDW